MRLIGILLLIASVFACDLFRKAPRDERVYDEEEEIGELTGQRVYNEETGRYEVIQEPVGKMDTVRWTVVEATPITSETEKTGTDTGTTTGTGTGTATDADDPDTEYKERYRLTLALPFVTSRNQGFLEGGVYENSKWALQFYAGAKVALRELADDGMTLDVRVVDTEASAQELRSLLASDFDLQNSDLIIGPYRRENAQLLADFGKANQKIVVSPYTASSNVTRDNPYYIQVNPSLTSHLDALLEHAKARYDDAQITLVIPDTDENRSLGRYLQLANQRLEGRSDVEMLREVYVDPQDLSMQNLDLKPYFDETRESVFVVPVYRSENFVAALMRKLKVAAAPRVVNGVPGPMKPTVVYGMPQWRDYSRVDLDDYENLNVHISATDFMDRSNPETTDFREAFYRETGTLPTAPAYQGYDLTRYFGAMLREHGTQFQPWLEREPADLLHTRFNIQRALTTDPDANAETTEPPVEYWENKAVFILKFENYEFVPAR